MSARIVMRSLDWPVDVIPGCPLPARLDTDGRLLFAGCAPSLRRIHCAGSTEFAPVG